MSTTKMRASSIFPDITLRTYDGTLAELGKAASDSRWKMIVVYRGVHCPICTDYLNSLEGYRDELATMGIDVAAVSADSKEQLQKHKEKLEVSFPLYYGLTVDHMKTLGLYISHPRSDRETDHPFPEPGLFVVNEKGEVAVVELANNPVVRPDLERLVSGLAFIRDPENQYPVRGTFD